MRALASLLLVTAVAVADDDVRILRHDVDLTLDPKAGTFTSTDVVTLSKPGRLTVTAPDGVDLKVAPGEGATSIATFSGTIKNAIEKSAAPTWVAGDRTAGIIGERGSYLVRGFFVDGPPAPFRTTIRVPLPHRAVAPGRRVEESEEGGVYRAVFESSVPLDGLVVVTGPWVVDERTIDGVRCRTYLYEGDRAHHEVLLRTLEQEIPRWQKVFGPVPDGRFDVVENFFETGYGFSNFTLLGDNVIRYVCAKAARERAKTLPAGYLDHELVHCWLGNLLHVDYERGNWCEALTTYYANYGAAVREGRGPAHRTKVSRSFSLRVTGDLDVPVRTFRQKTHAHENDIGYGKGSMIFHMLAREIGRKEFNRAVRHVVETRAGRRLGWDDLVAGLSESVGRDLKPWFAPWLDRKGAPVLAWGDLAVHESTVTGVLRQTQAEEPFPLRVPVHVGTANGVEEHVVACASRATPFRVTVRGPVEWVAIDPDHHVFRRIPRDEVAPCLEAVLTSPEKVGFGDEALLQRLGVDAVEPGVPEDADLLALGVPADLRALLLKELPGRRVTLADGSFTLDGATFDQPGDGLLYTFRRRNGRLVSFFHGNGEAAFARARYLPYYASDGWVVFRGRGVFGRGMHEGEASTRRAVTEGTPKEASSLLTTLFELTDPVHAGRRAGTRPAYKLANTLRGKLFRLGLEVPAWPPVTIPVGRVVDDRRELVLLDGAAKVSLSGTFWPFHESVSPKTPPVFDRVVAHPAEDVAKALVLLPEDADASLARVYAEKGAAAVAVAGTSDDLAARGAEAAWANTQPPAEAARWAQRGGDPEIRTSGAMARSPAAPVPCAYVYVQKSAAEKLSAHAGGGVLRFTLKRNELSTSNVFGVLGDGKTRGIMLGAHWDGAGVVDGEASQGASDNAAGVAVVLWVAEQLKRDFDAGRLKKPVVVALFGGEEMGLWGSRQFAALANAAKSPIALPEALVNVDGVGNRTDGEVFLIGRSHYEPLAAKFDEALKKANLQPGRDIDKFAFAHGSDHWPLHEAGVPAVTIFAADYRRMNTPHDTVAHIDAERLHQIAVATYRMVRALAE